MKKIKFLLLIVIAFSLTKCHDTKKDDDDDTASATEVKTPVTVEAVQRMAISEHITLNATSVYQKKNAVRSNINGYIEKALVAVGDYIESGKPMFIIKTKEADALSQFNKKDSPSAFKGEITIYAPATGTVTELTKQSNDYVNDGDQLAIIAQQSSFVFLLNVPFELNKYAAIGTACNVVLPDSTVLNGTIASKLPTMDATTQTQSYVVKVETTKLLPENLLATIQLIKRTSNNAQVLDKSCVLTNETMQDFWVMKLVNDTTAMRQDVKTGIVSGQKVEILSPTFTDKDRIISSGNYGLHDTAYVNVIKK